MKRHVKLLTALIALVSGMTLEASVKAQTAPCNPAITDCYGFNVNARVASGSAAQGQSVNDGPTSASVAASYTIPGDEVYSGPNYASASANLATGAVRARVDAFAGGGQADAYWFERVTFNLPSGVSSVDIPVVWRIEGSNLLQSYKPSPTFSAGQSISAYFRTFAFQNGHDAIDLKVLDCATSTLCTIGPVSEVFFDTFTAEANVVYEMGMGISLTGYNINKDFSNTSFVNFALPDGVTINSASGVVLSQQISVANAVPEPATWAMLLIGFGAIGAGLRSRRNDQAQPGAA